MKISRTIKKVMLFVGGLIVLNGLIQFAYLSMMDGAYIRKVDAKLFANPKGSQINYLILGHSHAFEILEEYWEGSAQFGSYGEDISRTYYKLNFLLDQGDLKIKNVVLPHDLGYVGQVGLTNENLNYWTKYVDFGELGSLTGQRLEYVKKWLKGSFFTYADGDMNMWEYLFPPEKVDGGLMVNAEAVAPFSAKDTVGYELSDSVFRSQFDPVAMVYWERLIQLCAVNQIAVALVKYPVSKRFYYTQTREFDVERYYGVLESKLDSINVEYKILDFQDMFFEDDTKFRDAHHLQGGEVRVHFTKMLRKRLAE